MTVSISNILGFFSSSVGSRSDMSEDMSPWDGVDSLETTGENCTVSSEVKTKMDNGNGLL
jgi:hypothetical protein